MCTGAGGLELGLRLALGDNVSTVCYVEREAYAAAVIVARMADQTLDTAPIWDDVRTFDGQPWRGLVDILCAGYPCQPFSLAGKGLAEEDPRHLWPEVARIIGQVEPRYVFCENVASHLSRGFEQVSTNLQAMGYSVAAGLFSAEEMGAPHRRQRLYFLARKDTHSNGYGCEGLQEARLYADGQSGDYPHGLCTPGNAANPYSGKLRKQSRRSGGQSGPGSAQLRIPSPSRKTPGPGVPNPTSEGLENGQGKEGICLEPSTPGGTSSPGLSGPGPDLWPAQPPVCGVANGLASRMERLQLIGNGVIPIVAFIALASFLERG